MSAIDRQDVAQPRLAKKLYPRDDSASEPSFYSFKRRVLSAAERGDVAILKDAMAARIRIDFETEASPDEAVTHLGLKQGSPWKELRDALRLGAVRETVDGEETFIAPYVSAGNADLQPEEIVITGRNVSVREAPRQDARRIDVVSYDVVSRGLEWPGPAPWTQIVTPLGKVGFVHNTFARSVDDYRFRFRRTSGDWKLASILGGV